METNRSTGKTGPNLYRKLHPFETMVYPDRRTKDAGHQKTPAPAAKPHLVLDRDMDDFDLEAALRGLPDHAVVQLGPITLQLKRPATLTKPLTLHGSGMNRTRIVCQTVQKMTDTASTSAAWPTQP